MTAMEKVAWTEVIVTSAALLTTAALLPLLGQGAWGAFGLMGLLGLGGLFFLRSPAGRTVIDERDREIELRAMRWGVGSAWQLLFMALIGLVLWSSYYNDNVVPTKLLTWLVWIQFAVCYLVKGLVALKSYRSQAHAA